MRSLADFFVLAFIIYCFVTVFLLNAVLIDGCGVDIMLSQNNTIDVDWLSHFDQIEGSYARVATMNVNIEWTEIEILKENGWELIGLNTNIVTQEYIFQRVETEKEITQVSG